jgi:hypothetical protein
MQKVLKSRLILTSLQANNEMKEIKRNALNANQT